MPTLFDPSTYQDILRRLDSLQPTSPRQWGKMSPAQMLEHLARAVEMALADPPMKQLFIGKLIAWTARGRFLGPEPFAKNLPTAPSFRIADEPHFDRTKERVKAVLARFQAQGETGCDGHVHGFFGKMSGAEWGVSQYKHFDHHLRQFGV